jgi:hypothetical protein
VTLFHMVVYAIIILLVVAVIVTLLGLPAVVLQVAAVLLLVGILFAGLSGRNRVP